MDHWISKKKRIRIVNGDCLKVLDRLPDNCVDTVITDPPYNLTARSRITTGGGFMGQKWDATGIAFDPETWK